MNAATRLPFFAGFLCGLLVAWAAACGGGGGANSAPPVAAFYGDSLLSGDIAVAAGEPARRIEVPPVARVQEYAAGRFTTTADAVPGTKVAQALARGLEFTAPIIVIRYGGSDAILGTNAGAFERDLTALVRQAAGRRVVLIGLIHSINYEVRAIEIDARIRAVSQAQGLQFVDTMALPFAGATDLVDGIHPTQAYSDRQARLIADALLAAEAGNA